MKRLLFLDLDGVLHSVDAAEIEYTSKGIQVTGTRLFSRLPELDRLLARCTDVSIAISSSWQDHYTLEDLRSLLGTAGYRVIGSTRSINGSGRDRTWSRFDECQAAAKVWGANNWVIVDDQPSIVWGNHVPTRSELARVVFCDPVLGLTPMIVETLARKLS